MDQRPNQQGKNFIFNCGVYCLLNMINGNKYIGSSVNISGRMRNYLNTNFLKHSHNKNMAITRALLNYGYDNFSVLILKHTDLKDLYNTETNYIQKYLPHYNVLFQAGSSIRYRHTEAT